MGRAEPIVVTVATIILFLVNRMGKFCFNPRDGTNIFLTLLPKYR